MNISIDFSNTTLDITGNSQNGSLIINNKINANDVINANGGVIITGDTIIGENITDKMIINSETNFTGDLNCNSNILSHKFIYKNITGYENLYYWEGIEVLNSSTTSTTEPYGYNNGEYFERLTKYNGIQIGEHYHTNIWNGSYMFQVYNQTMDSRPSPSDFSSSYNYLELKMPVKHVYLIHFL